MEQENVRSRLSNRRKLSISACTHTYYTHPSNSNPKWFDSIPFAAPGHCHRQWPRSTSRGRGPCRSSKASKGKARLRVDIQDLRGTLYGASLYNALWLTCEIIICYPPLSFVSSSSLWSYQMHLLSFHFQVSLEAYPPLLDPNEVKGGHRGFGPQMMLKQK
jgi:hypothetical protein